MAGESPDKSEQRKASGEAAAGERDPRLRVLGESGAGVAVVQSADDRAEGAEGAEGSGEPESSGEPEGSAPEHEVAPEEPGEVRPAPRTEQGAPGGGDADAKTAKPSEGSGASEDGAEAEAPTGGDARLKAAVAAWVADAEGADGAEDKGADEVAAKAPAPAAGSGAVPPKDAEAEAKDKDKGKDAEAAKAAVDQPTAVFGAVPSKDAEAAGTEGKKAEEKKAEGKKPVDQPTAVFGKVAATDPAPASVDQPTELLKAPPVAPGGGERKSQFVPLKTDDAAPPVKPAVPVKVTPPAPAAHPAAPAGPAESERTKQTPQPAGPDGQQQAPLDLLAELTNSPPPPETPVRTAVRRVKIWTPIVVLLAIIFCVVQMFRPLPDTKLGADGAKTSYTFGGKTFAMPWPTRGQSAAKVLGTGDVGTSGEQKPMPTASVAKVMTAYVVLKDHPLKKGEKKGPMINVDEQAEKDGDIDGESTAKVKAGQSYSEYDMLRMLLIPSGNNIARLLARWDAPSKEAFVKKMNDAAKELGMTNTVYTDPSGLDASTKSTAVDQVKLAEVVIKNPVIRDIVGQPDAQIPGLPGKIYNNNGELVVNGTGGLGIKTGSSSPAGGTLMWAARRMIDGKEHVIVGATMDQRNPHSTDPNAHLAVVKEVSYKEIKALQDALASAVVVKKGDVVGYVDNGFGDKTAVVATKDVTAIGWPGLSSKFRLDTEGKQVSRSAKAHTVIGKLVIGDGADAVKVPVALKTDLAKPSFGEKLTRLG